MSVVSDGQAKVAGGRFARKFGNVFTGPDQFDNREAFARIRNPCSALESGLPGSRNACSPAIWTIRSQRVGARTTRRMDGALRDDKYRAVTPLAAIMKSSMMSLARFDLSPSRARI